VAVPFFPSETQARLKIFYIIQPHAHCDKNKDGSEMLDTTTLVLIGTGSSSLFVAFIEYAYQRKKRMYTEAA